MRGADTFTESLFTMRHLDDFVPTDHPLRVIRAMANKALANMDGQFAQTVALIPKLKRLGLEFSPKIPEIGDVLAALLRV
jgi:hypothetical protein